MEVKMYHKPTCSTSRKALGVLKEAGIEPELILYIRDIPSKRSLRSLAKKLGGIENMIRTKEAVYKENYKGNTYTEDEWIDILREHPNLIERPIVLKGRKAVIPRPIEKLDDFLKL